MIGNIPDCRHDRKCSYPMPMSKISFLPARTKHRFTTEISIKPNLFPEWFLSLRRAAKLLDFDLRRHEPGKRPIGCVGASNVHQPRTSNVVYFRWQTSKQVDDATRFQLCNMWLTLCSLLSPNRSDDTAEYFSDFYAYHINTNTWNKLYVDIAHSLASNPDIQSVKSRINHSMLYDDVSYDPSRCC